MIIYNLYHALVLTMCVYTHTYGLPWYSLVNNPAANAEDMGLIPVFGISTPIFLPGKS